MRGHLLVTGREKAKKAPRPHECKVPPTTFMFFRAYREGAQWQCLGCGKVYLLKKLGEVNYVMGGYETYLDWQYLRTDPIPTGWADSWPC